MDERLFARLAALLEREPVVLASVHATRGATPRLAGSRMLITAQSAEFSVGGGMAEVRIIDAARALLRSEHDASEVSIDLRGGAGSAGVCGGTMQIVLSRWHGAEHLAHAHTIAASLQRGESTVFRDLHGATAEEVLHPNTRLLIVGAGHCGLALYDLAQSLDFDLWVHDERVECFQGASLAAARRLCGPAALLEQAVQTQRDVYAVLLNRDFAADVAALNVLCRTPPRFIGMMGSNKRIAEVVRALPQHRRALSTLHAPIGIEIDAQTPHEIAISILAELVRERRHAARTN